MTLQGGDHAYPDGDVITAVNAEGAPLKPGAFVAVTGHTGDHPEVQLADTADGNDLVGVVQADAGGADDGEPVAVVLRGAPLALVESGVTAGAELGAPDTGAGGTAGVAVSGGSTGIYTLDDAEELEAGSGDYYAPAHLD